MSEKDKKQQQGFDISNINWLELVEAAQSSKLLTKVVDGRFSKCREVDVELVFPIVVNGAEKSVLTMKRPSLAIQNYVSQMGLKGRERDIALFSKLCGLNPEDFQKLDEDDYDELVAVYENFFSTHPRTKVQTSGQ